MKHFLNIAVIEFLLLRSSDCVINPFIFEDNFPAHDVTNFDGLKFRKTCSPMTLTGTTPYIRLTETQYSFEDVKKFRRSQGADVKLLVYSTETPGECLLEYRDELDRLIKYEGLVYRFERTAKDKYTLVQRVEFTD